MIKFFHQGIEGKKGGTTLGYQQVGEGKYIVTFARCSDAPKSTDVFNKKKSRLICIGRMAKGVKVRVAEKPVGMDKYEFFKTLIAENDQRVKEQYGQKAG